MSSSITKNNLKSNITRVINTHSKSAIGIMNTTHKSLVEYLKETFQNKKESETTSIKLDNLVSHEHMVDNNSLICIIDEYSWSNSEEEIISNLRALSLESIDYVIYTENNTSLNKKISSSVDVKIIPNITELIELL